MANNEMISKQLTRKPSSSADEFSMNFRIMLKTVFVLNFVVSVLSATQNRIRFDRCEMCDQSENNAILVQFSKLRNVESENEYISLTITFLRDVGTDINLEVKITRCINKEALDTCVPFTTLKPINSCGLLSSKFMAWSDIVASFKPPLKCPLMKGEYILTNGTVDLDLFKFFPIDNFYWRANLSFFHGKEFLIICTDVKVIRIVH